MINEIPNISGLVNSLYDCRYRDFMVAVVELNSQLESDRYFARHSTYLVRELRILAYTQVCRRFCVVGFWLWLWCLAFVCFVGFCLAVQVSHPTGS